MCQPNIFDVHSGTTIYTRDRDAVFNKKICQIIKISARDLHFVHTVPCRICLPERSHKTFSFKHKSKLISDSNELTPTCRPRVCAI